MKVGDGVAVLQIVFNGVVGRTAKTPAVVTAVRRGSFEVRALHGAFDDEGHDRLWLQADMKGRTWE